VFCDWWRVCFAKEMDVVVTGKRIFVKRHFGSSLNRVLDGIKICRFSKDRIFDDSEQFVRLPTFWTVLMRFYCEGPMMSAQEDVAYVSMGDMYSLSMSSFVLIETGHFLLGKSFPRARVAFLVMSVTC